MSNSPETALAEQSPAAFGFQGEGQKHTNKRTELPYHAISYEHVLNLAVAPPVVPIKGDNAWFIPSSYRKGGGSGDARRFVKQREVGEYNALVGDVDGGQHSLAEVCEAVRNTIGHGYSFLVYSTHSATADNPKWRIVVPSNVFGFRGANSTATYHPIRGRIWKHVQDALTARLAAFGVTADTTAGRSAQIFFLPAKQTDQAFYQHHIEQGVTFTLIDQTQDPDAPLHPLAQDANTRFAAEQQEEAQQDKGEGKKLYTPIWHFRQVYDLETVLDSRGFLNKSGTHKYRSPHSSGDDGFGLEVYPHDETWSSFHGSDSNMGRLANNKEQNTGDVFDLEVKHYKLDNTEVEHPRDVLTQYARSLTLGYRPKTTTHVTYADVQAGLEIANYHEQMGAYLYAQYKHAETLAQIEANRQVEQEALEQIDANALAQHEEQQALLDATGEDWLKHVPFKIEKPNKMDYLAWTAPGVLGEVVRSAARQASRRTLIPTLAGAVLAVGHLTQGKYVVRLGAHTTPPGQALALLGDTGSAKGDSNKTFKSIVDLHPKDVKQTSVKVRKFRSGPSVTHYLADNPNVTIMHNEAGADNAAGSGDRHHDGMMSELTDVLTAFEQPLEQSLTMNKETSTAAIHNACLNVCWSSTPKKYLSTISASDAESGWLGRWITMFVSKARTNKNAEGVRTYPLSVKSWVERVATTPPPQPNLNHSSPDVYVGAKQGFHMLRFSPEAMQYIDHLIDVFDDRSEDPNRSPIDQAISNRAVEAITKLAFNAGLACIGYAVGADKHVSVDCVKWAEQVYLANLDFMAPAVANGVESDGVTDIVRARIDNQFRKFSTVAERKKQGSKVNVREDGKIEIQRSYLLQSVKGGKYRSADIKQELDSMVDTGELLAEERTNLNNSKATTWLRQIPK